MKALIEGVEVEGTPTELAEFIRALQEDDSSSQPAAQLTPRSREAFNVIAKYPKGMHYTALAEELGVSITTANGRCQTLRKKGIVERVENGIYRIKESW